MRKYIEQEAAALEGGSENSRTEPEMGVYVRIEDVMMPQEDLIETFAKAAAKEQDEAIAGEICQVLEKQEGKKPVTVETNIYDTEEIHHGCTVQVLRNSVTGDVSVGWWEEREKKENGK